jgi:CRP/FNR family transcriptional regulator, anaerobic regulatory protein
MKEEFQNYQEYFLRLFVHLNAEEIDFIRSHLTISTYQKNDFLFKSGQVQKEMGFVCKGLLRRYYIDKRGKKITTAFINENKYATDYPAFIRQKPTNYFIECLEPSVIIKLSYDKIQEGYRKYKNSEMYGRLIAEQVLTIQHDRIESFLFESAEERYLNFINQNKNIINRISLSHLCSYLGIERQSLSRIRKRLARK